MINIEEILDKYYNHDEKVILACSTGPDSMFLLYKLLESKYKDNIVVCYFNHKLRPEADLEEKWIENMGKEKGFTVEIAEAKIREIREKFHPSKSVEELAREKRYEFMNAILNIYNADKIITGHHLDDKIETFFFNLARGSKLTGLINMTEKSGNIIRPLLDIEKSAILNYMDENKLEYKIDGTNTDTKITRNKLRHDIIPKFGKINTNYKSNINNLIKYFEELKDFIDHEVDLFLEEEGILIFNSGEYKINTLEIYGYFYIDHFNALPKIFQKEVIRKIFHITNGKSTIGLSEANIIDIIKFINGKNNKTIKEIRELKLKKENKIIIY